jgi:hypothetical protein
MTGQKLYTDEQIAAALRANGGSVIRAAAWMGASVLTLRNRIARSRELERLRVVQKKGRKAPHTVTERHRANRVVTDEEIVIALDAANSVKTAADAIGVQRQTILSRAREPEIRAALDRCEQRYKQSRIDRVQGRREIVAEQVRVLEEHATEVAEMRDAWNRQRDSWIIEARRRRLTLFEMGQILSVTRERVRQIEIAVGLRPRTGGDREADGRRLNGGGGRRARAAANSASGGRSAA